MTPKEHELSIDWLWLNDKVPSLLELFGTYAELTQNYRELQEAVIVEYHPEYTTTEEKIQ